MTADDRWVVSERQVRRLIDSQFPQWASLPVRRVAIDGWDNTTFRLGETLKVRLPTARRYVAQVEKEQRWLPYLAGQLPLPIPEPVAMGQPAEDYPYPWSIYRWIEGDAASTATISDRVALARDLAVFLLALQRIPPDQAPLAGAHNFFRGGDLRVYDDEVRRCLQAAPGGIDAIAARAVWETALAAHSPLPRVWLHGDFSASNFLVDDGRLAAIIDFGNCAVGDPACDLVIAWTFLAGESRETFRSTVIADSAIADAAIADAATWARARGWALWKALLTITQDGTDRAALYAAQHVIAAVVAEDRQARASS